MRLPALVLIAGLSVIPAGPMQRSETQDVAPVISETS
jgi:hypothetical protein